MANTRVTTPVTDFDKTNTTQGLKLPSGTNSNQPIGVDAIQGMLRNDTDETVDSSASTLTHYNGTNWQYFAATESPDVVYPTSLMQYLDASNANSYSGTGSTWSDLTGNGNNAVFSIASPIWTSGSPSYFDFSPTSTYLTLDQAVVFGTSSYSINFWLNLDSLSPETQYVFCTYNAAGHGWLWRTGANGTMLIYDAGQPTGATSANNRNVAGVWTMWTLTLDRSSNPDSYKLYYNKTQDYVTTGANLGATNGSPPEIGKYPGTATSSLDGKVSKVRVYDTALTQTEIDALHNEGP